MEQLKNFADKWGVTVIMAAQGLWLITTLMRKVKK